MEDLAGKSSCRSSTTTHISQLKCGLGRLIHEHDELKHTHDVYKSRATTIIDEKNRHISGLEDKVRIWEKLLADAQQHLRDQQKQSAQFETQLLKKDTELANMWHSYEEKLQRQRALQKSQLGELGKQAADLRAQITQAKQDRDQEASQAQARIVEPNNKEAECKKNQERIPELEVGQKSFLAKVSKLETQLRLVSHSEITLKHSLRRREDELETMKEKLAKMNRLRNEVTQLQESMKRVREKVEGLEEAADNASNCVCMSDLACNVAVLEEQSCVERECKRQSGIYINEHGEVSTGGVCSLSFGGDITTPCLPSSPLFDDCDMEEWLPPIRDWSRQLQLKQPTTTTYDLP
ncbi:hypothetical protein HPB51_017560 [Rhipicephalus microplus]|uniref:Uncharacterized protein n=1 Tax=Rhipicephalus microplus TaxID=6941 RepID=A0A9J6F5C3_RHIMP|nr:hypothetical protein HPB51_017560 [Rhipicephalus microplus]